MSDNWPNYLKVSCETNTYHDITKDYMQSYLIAINVCNKIKESTDKQKIADDEYVYYNNLCNTYKTIIQEREKKFKEEISEFINKDVSNDNIEQYIDNLHIKIENYYVKVFNLWIDNNNEIFTYKSILKLRDILKDVKDDINNIDYYITDFTNKFNELSNSKPEIIYYKFRKEIRDKEEK